MQGCQPSVPVHSVVLPLGQPEEQHGRPDDRDRWRQRPPDPLGQVWRDEPARRPHQSDEGGADRRGVQRRPIEAGRHGLICPLATHTVVQAEPSSLVITSPLVVPPRITAFSLSVSPWCQTTSATSPSAPAISRRYPPALSARRTTGLEQRLLAIGRPFLDDRAAAQAKLCRASGLLNNLDLRQPAPLAPVLAPRGLPCNACRM